MAIETRSPHFDNALLAPENWGDETGIHEYFSRWRTKRLATQPGKRTDRTTYKIFIMENIVVVDCIRTGLAKAHRGTFNLTRSDELVAHCIINN